MNNTAPDITLFTYDQSSAKRYNALSIDDLPRQKQKKTINWINVVGVEDSESIRKITEIYNIHPLTLEDVLDTTQQPKVESFDNYSFISLKAIRLNAEFKHQQKRKQDDYVEEFLMEQISIIKMKNIIITFQEIPSDPFDSIRKRILENIGQIRKTGTDYLSYLLIDAIVDEYYLTLAHLEEDIENYEDRAVKTNDDSFFMEIQETKRFLLQIKHAMLPQREILMILSRRDILIMGEELKPFLQDLRENLNNAIATIENYREWLTNVLDVNLSFLSHQMNKVMKILAIISSIFIPLTFIAGIYGMNFKFMPELDNQLAYPIVLCCMGVIALLMVLFFKIRRWF